MEIKEQDLRRAAKILLDNPEFKVVMSYAEASMLDSLVEGNIDDAETNLRNLRAVRGLQQLVKNWAYDERKDS